MKLKKGLIVSEVNGQYIAVAVDEAGKALNGMLKLNGTAAFIVGKLQNETGEAEIAAAMCDKYDVTEQTAAESVSKTIDILRSAGLIEE